MLATWIILIITVLETSRALRGIPEELLPCYRGEEGPKLPATMRTVVELIRKLERSQTVAMDMRMMSYSLLHRYRIDGIEHARGISQTEHVTPYREAGLQVPKYQLLLERLVPADAEQGNWLNDTALTTWERCALHKFLSSSVDPWERGDEHSVCSLTRTVNGKVENINTQYLKQRRAYANTASSQIISAAEISRCPIQGGIVSTTWGDVAPGVFLGAIAAILQPQEVHPMDLLFGIGSEQRDMIRSRELVQEFEKTQEVISNVWAATLAGDLAEVAIYQGPYFGEAFTLGPGGQWNDSILPRDSYMPQNHRGRWEMTNAEILSGLDGLILLVSLPTWVSITSRLRLSQIFEGYYSERGINFLGSRTAACERRRMLDSVVPQELLAQQSAAIAQVLSYTANVPYVQRSVMDSLCYVASITLLNYTERLLSSVQGCSMERAGAKNTAPSIRLTIIVDGTYSKYEFEEILSLLSEAADISVFGSSLGVIHGQTGTWITPHTNSVAELYAHIHNYTGPWPTALHLTTALEKLVWFLQQPTDRKAGDNAHCIVVLAQESQLTSQDVRTAKLLLQNTIGQYPDLYFRYVTRDTQAFNELAVDPLHTEKQISVPSSEPTIVVNALSKSLEIIPKRLVSEYCHSENRSLQHTVVDYEDYITPGYSVQYRIHPYYLKFTDEVFIHFRGFGYGELSICLARDHSYSNENCRTLGGLNDVTFNITNPCENIAQCAPAFITVSVANTGTRCAENDCRFPDQVRYSIRHEGLRCETDGVNTGSMNYSLSSIYIIITLITMLLHTII